MDKQERRKLKRKIRSAYSKENPDRKIQQIVEGMPKRYRDMLLSKIVEKSDWNKMQETYYYSERQLRNIMNEALEEFRRRMLDQKTTG